MKAHELVSAVQESARIPDHDHVDQAVRATLAVLGQRFSTEAKDHAAQLPPELAEAIPTDDSVERFRLGEFYDRVAEGEGRGCSPEQARQHARSVTAALREAVGPEYLHVPDQLPGDYSDLMHHRERPALTIKTEHRRRQACRPGRHRSPTARRPAASWLAG